MPYKSKNRAAEVKHDSYIYAGCGRNMIDAEIAKCDLVCSNCHRVRHNACR